MGGIRRSKKRKIAGLEMKATTLTLTSEAREMLDRMAGPESLSNTADKIIKYVYRKKERKHESQQVC